MYKTLKLLVDNYEILSTNLVKFQDIKLTQRNLLHSYAVTKKIRIRSQGSNLIYHCIKKKKKSRNKPKEAKVLYSENYKIFVKEIKDDTNI